MDVHVGGTRLVCMEMQTKMVMTHAGIPGDSPGAARWAMALDKLAAHVEAHSHR